MKDKKFVYTRKDANIFSKVGIDLAVYPTVSEYSNSVYIEVEKGHYEEFYNKKSWFVYYVIEGKGSFFIDEKEYKVKSTDMVSIPPMHKIYYKGKMKLLLTVTPPYNENDEVHVRMVDV